MSVKCFICGESCRDHGPGWQSACIECTKKLFKIKYNYAASPINGDGFPFKGNEWGPAIKAVKAEFNEKWKNKMTPCIVCGSDCKDRGNTVNSACSVCSNKIHGTNNGLDLSDGDGFPKDTYWDIKIKAAKKDFAIPKTKCYCCDKECTDHNAAYISICYDCDCLAHKEIYGEKRLPLSMDGGAVRYDNSTWITVINKIRDQIYSKKIADLKIGDRVEIKYLDNIITGTYVSYNENELFKTFVLDKAQPYAGLWFSGEAKKLGVNENEHSRWTIYDGKCLSSITKILPPIKSQPKFGDRVEVKVGNKLLTGTYVYDHDDQSYGIVNLDTPSHLASPWFEPSDLAIKARAAGLSTHEATHFTIYKSDSNTSIRILDSHEKGKVSEEVMTINVWDLSEGDQIEVKIEDDCADNERFNIVKGTFLARQDDGTAIISLNIPYETGNLESNSWYGHDISGDNLKKIASKFDVKTNKNTLWTIEDNSDCETKILKILKHQKAKDSVMKDSSTGMNVGVVDTFKKDMGKALVRSGTSAGIDGLKAGIRKVLSHEGMDGPGAEAIMKFFEGDFGEACLRGALGYTLLTLPIPFIQENEYAQQVSEELRVSGLDKGLTKGRKMVEDFILPSILEAFANTPLMAKIAGEEENKARIAEAIAPQRIATPAPVEHQEFEVEADPFKAPKAASL